MSAAIAEHAGEIGRGTMAPASALPKAAAAWAFRAVGCVPIYFAAKIGYKASLGQGEDWASVAICTTVAAALILLVAEISLKRRMFAAGLIMLALGFGLGGWSMVIASGNVAALDIKANAEHGANERTIKNLEDQRRDAVDRRDRNKTAAKGETEESALSKIERLGRYPSARKIAELKEKAAAAKAYAKAVEDIAAIDAKLGVQGVVAVSTGQTAGAKLAAVITRVGHIDNVDGEAVFEWGRGGVLELLSTISLAVMDMLAWLLGGADKAEERRNAEKARKAREAEEAEARRRETEARFAAEFEAKAAAEAEEKARAERAAKRAEAKTRETGDPETVKAWLNSSRTVLSPGHVLPLPVAYESYAADCRAHGETPVSRGKRFAEELRKLDIDVRERANRRRFEVYGLALSSQAARGGLRVAFSR